MIYGYCRCSTTETAGLQSFSHQEEELIKHGVSPENIYKERISGVKENKPVLNNLLDKIDNPIIGKSLLTTFHKLNYCNYKTFAEAKVMKNIFHFPR